MLFQVPTGINLPLKKGTKFLLSLFEPKSNLLTNQSAAATARRVAFFPTALTLNENQVIRRSASQADEVAWGEDT
jgi:hypothetical protein